MRVDDWLESEQSENRCSCMQPALDPFYDQDKYQKKTVVGKDYTRKSLQYQ